MRPNLHRAGLSSSAFLWLVLGLSSIAFAQTPIRNATFRTTPSPPTANQPFDAVFGAVMHFDATGFYGAHPQYRVLGDKIDILFDTSCLLICDPNVGSYTEYPLVMPALPAGSYTVRFAMGEFDNPSEVLGAFPLVVGGAAQPAQLPLGDSVAWLLSLLLIVAAILQTRRTGASLAKSK